MSHGALRLYRPLGTRGVLLAAAIALGGAAPFAGSPLAARHARLDVPRLASIVQREEDHVTALELAGWIRERRDGLRIIDVRSAEEFAEYHLPTAERAPLDSVIAIPFRAGETIVLYSEGGAHAAQAWVLLRALGYERVYFLRGGLGEWLDDVMNPTLGDGASVEERAAFARTAEVSRYFGGQPRIGVPSAIPTPAGTTTGAAGERSATAARVRALRRRGC